MWDQVPCSNILSCFIFSQCMITMTLGKSRWTSLHFFHPKNSLLPFWKSSPPMWLVVVMKVISSPYSLVVLLFLFDLCATFLSYKDIGRDHSTSKGFSLAWLLVFTKRFLPERKQTNRVTDKRCKRLCKCQKPCKRVTSARRAGKDIFSSQNNIFISS